MVRLKRETAPRRYEQVQEEILRMIMSGELAPGDQLLPERELAAQLGVSRPSVRMALSSLASRGLVGITPRGTFVTQTDLGQALGPIMAIMVSQSHAVQEYTEFRRILEPGAVRLAARNAGPDDIRQMEQCITEMEKAVREGRSPLEPDVQFHHALGRASHNLFINQIMVLVSAVASHQEYAPILEAVYAPPGELDSWIGRSRAILSAIRAHDPEAAAREMTAYLDRVEAIVKDYFANRVS